MRLPVVVAASVLAAACYKTEKPVVKACGAPGFFGSAPSEGSFTILPSRVPGIEITNASWRTRGGSDEFVNIENLWLSTTVHAERRVPQEEIAVVYDAPGPNAIVDEILLEEGVDQYNLGLSKPFLEAGGSKTVGTVLQLRAAYWIGRTSALTYCPRTVQIVPRNALALALAPELETPRGQAARLRSIGAISPLTVIMDSVFQKEPSDGFVAGAALNTTDSTLRDMAVGLVVSLDTIAPSLYEGGPRQADTLEYYVGDVAPHALAPFGGAHVQGTERIISRVSYHPADVRRRIASNAEINRASNVFPKPADPAPEDTGCTYNANTVSCPKVATP